MTLRFGPRSTLSTEITTRQTLPHVADETRIYNLYVYLFNSEGRKIYGHYFDATNMVAENELEGVEEDSWYVSLPSTNDSQDCWGIVKVYTAKHADCSVFAIANIDSKMVNISPEKLSLVQEREHLLQMVATLNQEYVERTGYFAMTGYIDGIDTETIDSSNSVLPLTRMDAKIRFWFKAGDQIKTLEIKNWRVVNVPRDAYIMSRDVRDHFGYTTEDSGLSYFDIEARPMEDEMVIDQATNKQQYGFSFYLLENALKPQSDPGVWSYWHREAQLKSGEGLNGGFEFAHPNSTYVVVSATIIMDTEYDYDQDNSTAEQGATLNADVEYVIHLGDFSGGKYDNFETLRNNYYTYSVTVNGAKDIRVEVESSNTGDLNDFEEPAPGATGEVTVAMQEIFECDAHYDTHVMTFKQEYIKADDMTWYVRTPFCENQNEPEYDENGAMITSGLDFRWVEFRINEQQGGQYRANRREYRPHPEARRLPGQEVANENKGGVWPQNDTGYNNTLLAATGYVDELVEWLRNQKRAYDRGESNAFDQNGEIKVTAFVNEYYYEYHPTLFVPITEDNTLWRRTITRDEPRVMHILADTKESIDRESKVIGSAFTIRQKSIQSVYNHNNEELLSAWGMEHTDEYESSRYLYQVEAANATNNTRQSGNTDLYNGRLNSMKEWGLVGNNNVFVGNQSWNTYLNLTGTNEDEVLRENYRRLRYSCLTRNRDNNGNGRIDLEEVRWYMASIRQLSGIWIGSQGVTPSAQLYQRSAVERADSDPNVWRQHVISSTADGTNSNNPRLIWAEEGSSTGTLYNSYQWAHSNGGNAANRALSGYTVRCVRNLNMDGDYAPTSVPEDYVIMEGTTTKPVFNLSRLNDRSWRMMYDNIDLVFTDENGFENRIYPYFEAYKDDSINFNAVDFMTMNNNISNTISGNPYCPSGYRLPNQRELSLMDLYLADAPYNFFANASECFTRTYFSFGTNGTQKENKGGYSRQQNVYVTQNQTTTRVRCVRDVYPTITD